MGDTIEEEYGLYPDIEDPEFQKKLFRKQEFAENRQEPLRVTQKAGIDLCDPSNEFELSPVQRFVSRFLSAESPYNSALLYHGVGVGKTCAAVSIAENYLRIFPRKKVIIVAPPNIQPNFRRTIFDIDKLRIGTEEFAPNTISGCTGDFYLKRTGTEFEREKGPIASRIRASIDARYEFVGYIQFARYIENIRRRYEDKTMSRDALRSEFEGRLIIIDEAHNLRDVPGETSEDMLDVAGGDEEVEDSAAGKRLTPSLLEVLDTVQGMKLCLLTATPMYNNYLEIIFLLNLMLKNDKRRELRASEIFQPNGKFTADGERLLGAAAGAYLSFMRGENPLSFPIRLPPGKNIPRLKTWPARAPNGEEVPVSKHVLRLPLVPVRFPEETLQVYAQLSDAVIRKSGMGVASIDMMTQTGNWLFPADASTAYEARKGDLGFDGCFSEVNGQFVSRNEAPTWLGVDELAIASPKAEFIIKNIQTARGVAFVYSRFVKSGALPLCLALEANGYTPYGRDVGFLRDGIQTEGGRQCAYCPLREANHRAATHGRFVPAKYVLLTGKGSLSPNNAAMVNAARSDANMNGGVVKVIVGSQVASEGIDLRFVREIYVFDSWFHLNKMEQVLGRGVRTCSHSLLEPEQRNTTIYLLVNTYPASEDIETADLYMYRTAMGKAQQVGSVSRVLKRYALDCNLNIDAIVIPGEGENALEDQIHENAHGEPTKVSLADAPYTAICDWIETCDYTCAIPVDFDELTRDISTYDEYSARWREASLKTAIRKLFEENDQPFFTLESIQEIFSMIPRPALRALLADIVGNESFRISVKGRGGFIIYRNGYYLFQPDRLRDTQIPLALRVQRYPVKRDIYEPTLQEIVRREVVGTNVWPYFVIWAQKIRAGEIMKDIPTEVVEGLQARYTDPAELTKEQQHIFGVLWFYDVMRDSEVYRGKLADALLGLVWDELLTVKEQQELAENEEAQRIGSEQFRAKGGRKIFRFIEAHTGNIKYNCGAAACDVAVARLFDSDPADVLKANNVTSGPTYGFIVPDVKRSIYVFKTTDKPAEPEGQPPKGGVCEKITQISAHFEHLNSIGVMLQNAGLPNFGMTKEGFVGTRKFENSTRACSLKNVILRWMDLMAVGGRRWFYRPIAAYKSNHRVRRIEEKKSSRSTKAKI
jgi:hypothetical protein